MKLILLFISVFLSWLLDSQSFFDRADAFFSNYVKDGLLDYQSIKNNPTQLNELVQQIAELNLSNKRVTPDFLKAFYINSYNVLVIKQVVDLYPIEGPLEVEGFFNSYQHEVMGRKVTLDQLEKEMLYQQFPDARLHFVLVCAAKGCPPLADFGYQPKNIEQQLDARTTKILNSDSFIRVNESKVSVSEIFKWYENDFGDLKSFINRYRENQFDLNVVIDYYSYDWSLNEINSK